MKTLLLAVSALALTSGATLAEDVKIGTLLGLTGPIESIAPNMFTAVDMALPK
jgi:branched-chain amino acid transport system substrate-binding protein